MLTVDLDLKHRGATRARHGQRHLRGKQPDTRAARPADPRSSLRDGVEHLTSQWSWNRVRVANPVGIRGQHAGTRDESLQQPLDLRGLLEPLESDRVRHCCCSVHGEQVTVPGIRIEFVRLRTCIGETTYCGDVMSSGRALAAFGEPHETYQWSPGASTPQNNCPGSDSMAPAVLAEAIEFKGVERSASCFIVGCARVRAEPHTERRVSVLCKHHRRQTMDDDTTAFVGLDVHKDSIAVGLAEAGRAAPRFLGTCGPQLRQLLKALAHAGTPERVHVAYEAGPCGYTLARALIERGYRCEVIAVAKIPASAGRAGKDRSARCADAGELSALRRAHRREDPGRTG